MGIEHYYSQFSIDKGSIAGAGEAVIHEVLLASADSMPSDQNGFQVAYLDSLDIFLTFSMSDSIGKVDIKLLFYDQEFDEIAACYSILNDFLIENSGGKVKVRTHIPALLLCPGTYYLTVTIRENDTKRVLVRYHAIRNFNVSGSFESTAAVQLPAEWSLLE